ncbi:MAG TPA: hypothetical protein VEA92_00555 [Candidatus Paceibacterota bacterium]|nr:hypothetical protein [Candidatus Paceibacterota bacterium]
MIRTPLALLLVAALLFTSVPRTTHAQFIVQDPINLIQNTITAASQGWDMLKEGGLDAIAWTMARSALQSVTKSTVNWINSGFDGSPAYVTDLNRNLLRVGDRVADDFFEELRDRNEIDSPFRDDIVQAVRDDYFRSTGSGSYFNTNRFTLNEVSEDPNAFLAGDFSKGGWDAWIEAWRNPQNNPIGALHEAQHELGSRVSSAEDQRRTELEWGRGFLSWRGECTTSSSAGDETVDLSGAESECAGGEIQTPGAVIEGQLEKTLGSQLDQLGLADEFNEIVGALLAQLTSNILGGSGLGGLTQPSSGGGSSYIDRASSSDQTNAQGANATFTQTLRNQRGQVETHKSNWQKIQGAAQAAASCTNDSEVQAVLTESAAAIARADAAVAGIDSLTTKLAAANNAAGGNQIAALEEVSTEYQQLMANTMPTASDLARSQTESRTSGEGGDSLYMQMTEKAKLCGRT